MIDWTKEMAVKNYCGYCNGTPTGSSCDGSCFDPLRSKFARENRVDHILTMLDLIPEKIEELEQKKLVYKNSLFA